jgi:hypothetical protein
VVALAGGIPAVRAFLLADTPYRDAARKISLQHGEARQREADAQQRQDERA